MTRGPLRLLVLTVLFGGGLIAGLLVTRAEEPGPAEEPDTADALRVAERVRVEVLNGGGTPGAARAATDVLRDAGFDVVAFQNAQNFADRPSVVIDRVGRPALARRVAGALGLDTVESEPDSTRLLEVTVILGTDWTAPVQAPPPPPARPWWDPRGYIPWLRR